MIKLDGQPSHHILYVYYVIPLIILLKLPPNIIYYSTNTSSFDLRELRYNSTLQILLAGGGKILTTRLIILNQ